MSESVSIESGGVPLTAYGKYSAERRTFDLQRVEVADSIENIAPLLSVSMMAELSEACAVSIHWQHAQAAHDLEALAVERTARRCMAAGAA